jgi:hypothetical protein
VDELEETMKGEPPVILGTVCVFPTPEPPACPDGENRSDDCTCRTAEIHPNGLPRPGPIGNTQGIIVPNTEPNLQGISGSEIKEPNPLSISAPEIKATIKEKSWWERWGSDVAHSTLDAVGLVPVLGEVADGANALIYLAEGNYVDAALSAAAMIPIGGQAATVAKFGKRVFKEGVEAAAEKAAKETTEKAAKETTEKAAKETTKKAAKETTQKAAKGTAD